MLALDRQGSCLPACDAYPYNLGDLNYKVTCQGYSEPSDSITSEAIVYQWNDPTPVIVGNTCTVQCRDSARSMLPNGMESFTLTCQSSGGSNEWDLSRPFPKCVRICDDPPALVEEEKLGLTTEDIIWSCTDGKYANSICTKACPAGYKLKKSSKKQLECKLKRGIPSWKGSVSFCIPE